ncbi:MAG TPA: chemotaxis protein CheA [Anaerolineae bacterium]|nr:chemotaxis protein CheA [Anaerolineae bacterium]
MPNDESKQAMSNGGPVVGLEFDLAPDEVDVLLQEMEELLQSLDESLMHLEQTGGDSALLQEIFRIVHTLKGLAGAISHRRMVALAHAMETLLEQLRQGSLAVTTPLIDALLDSLDVLRVLRDEVITQQDSDLELRPFLEKLEELQGSNPNAHTSKPAWESQTWRLPADRINAPQATQETWHQIYRIQAQIDQKSVAPAARALQVCLALEQVGHIIQCVPSRAQIERGEPCSLLCILFACNLEPEAVEALLSDISELLQVNVQPWNEQCKEEQGSITVAADTKEVAQRFSAIPQTWERREDREAPLVLPKESLRYPTGRVTPTPPKLTKTVRTSVERLDRLMNLVGELVTDRTRLAQLHSMLSARYGQEELIGQLQDTIAHLGWISNQLQEEVMQARMLPIANVFNKFPRLVRRLARETGKQVELIVEGQETELDRSVIEVISDPLMHLLRNAVDHGLETPAEREALGKPPVGRIWIAARSEEGQIVITVADDGRGIDVAGVKAAAIANGLISQEAAEQMSPREVVDLIFLPGLSTARQVSDVSGRGVGMDIVRTNVERLSGSVNVHSETGKGTTFELRLPLTLAIVPVLLVEVCGFTYAIPLSSVTETLRLQPTMLHRVQGHETIQLRGSILPLLRLTDQFFHGRSNGAEHRQHLFVVSIRWGDIQVGLVVDRLLGQQEIVIKSLGHMLSGIQGISGGAVLGDGSIALIIDIPGLIKSVLLDPGLWSGT